MRRLRDPILWLAAGFVLLVLFMPALRPFFAWGFPGIDPPIYERESFLVLFLDHAALVAVSSLLSTVLGVGLAIFVTRPAGRDFRALVDAVAAIGQTFPPAAVLAVTVPMVGFGALPAFIALSLYGLLPIVENAIAGLEGVPPSVRLAAEGMGLGPAHLLWQVDLPLAAPLIVSGMRISIIINIGTATIGSTVGARTLGTPIINGLVSEKLPYILQGAAVVGLFAILTDLLFERLDRRLRVPSS
jgi:osmoprotectant transport system permease protein